MPLRAMTLRAMTLRAKPKRAVGVAIATLAAIAFALVVWTWTSSAGPSEAAHGGEAPIPRVAASIAPVHSLAARVMDGVATPDLLMPPGASPHHHALRPSQAAALMEADVVIWIGAAVEPWMRNAAARRSDSAVVVALADAPGAVRRPARNAGAWSALMAAAKTAHAPNAAPAAVRFLDGHMWLDPENAVAWTRAIADALIEADPSRAALYRANAARAVADLEALAAELDAALAPVRTRPFVVFHDAFQYFEKRFALASAGAVAPPDAASPSARTVRAVRARLTALDRPCVFSEPQYPERAVRAVAEGVGAGFGVLDPLGVDIAPGPGQYPALMRGLAASLTACLAGDGRAAG